MLQDRTAGSAIIARGASKPTDAEASGRGSAKEIPTTGNDSGLPDDEVGAAKDTDDMFAGIPGVQH